LSLGSCNSVLILKVLGPAFNSEAIDNPKARATAAKSVERIAIPAKVISWASAASIRKGREGVNARSQAGCEDVSCQLSVVCWYEAMTFSSPSEA
jgi:hypothetical protein